MNGKYRCSYNDKTPCEPGAEEARQQQQARLPKYKAELSTNLREVSQEPEKVSIKNLSRHYAKLAL